MIDLSQAIGMRPLVPDERSTIIVTEYNRSVQAFLVGGVDRILNLNWESILPPPGGAGELSVPLLSSPFQTNLRFIPLAGVGHIQIPTIFSWAC